MWRSLILAVAATAALSGCYADHWQDTDILVSTMPPGADCTLTRGGEKVGEVNPTPGIAMVGRDAGDIAIACRRAGYADAAAVSHSLGNAVDMSTLTEGRSGYSYQTPIDIQLQPSR
ncbi:MAG TPA: hypothetical protein VGG57_03495 [Stellaceae bacterium]|jgi:hypothetical protein